MILYVDLDDTICNYTKRFNEVKDDCVYVEYPQSSANFYDFMEPVDGAIETIYDLSYLFDLYILTAPSPYNPLTYSGKAKWVGKHLGLEILKKLIICPNKGLLKGDVLIDDHIEGCGQENFEGKLIKFTNWYLTIKELKDYRINQFKTGDW